MSSRRVKPVLFVLLAVVAGIVGAGIATGLFGSVQREIGPIEAEISAAPSASGRTVVVVSPLGRLEAATHRAPVVITAVVEEAKADELRSILINQPEAQELVDKVTSDAVAAILALTKRLLILAALGGAAVAFAVFPGRRILSAAIGAGAGFLITALLLAATFLPYRAEAFNNPSLHGAIKSAPWVVKLAKERFSSLDDLNTEMRITARNVLKLQEQLAAIGSLQTPESQARILVISDLHNNVLAVNYLADIARLFDVQFILNAGDLTEFGTPFEDELAQQLKRFGRRQVFVAGNHDSPRTIAAISKLKGILMPHEKMIEVAGLIILGQHDPASLKPGEERELTASSTELSQSASRLKSVLAKQRRKPDIIMVHTPEVAEHFIGEVPILITGHSHRLRVEQKGETLWVNPGTSGAAGIRYFQGNGDKSISAVILYVTRRPEVKAVAADLISVTSPKGEFVVERKKF